MTKIIGCNCVSSQQDALHGEGNRVHNRTADKDKKIFRCTVCQNEKNLGDVGGVKGKKK